MTDNDLARIMFDPHADLTEEGRAILQRWTGEEQVVLGRLALRWAAALLLLDLGGLPLLLVLTAWSWYVAAAVWLVMLAMGLGVAARHYEWCRRRRAIALQERVAALLELTRHQARSTTAPRHRREPAKQRSAAPFTFST